MAGPESERLVRNALRCYPERWRSRHGEEAAELAMLLRDGGQPADFLRQPFLGPHQRNERRGKGRGACLARLPSRLSPLLRTLRSRLGPRGAGTG